MGRLVQIAALAARPDGMTRAIASCNLCRSRSSQEGGEAVGSWLTADLLVMCAGHARGHLCPWREDR